MNKARISMQNYMFSSFLIVVFFFALVAVLGLIFSSISMNSTYAQIEITTDENITSPNLIGR